MDLVIILPLPYSCNCPHYISWFLISTITLVPQQQVIIEKGVPATVRLKLMLQKVSVVVSRTQVQKCCVTQ